MAVPWMYRNCTECSGSGHTTARFKHKAYWT
jgi:hypothetical protein